jgi:VIT1/CCC1 family predicted Fe2+/Mn2+ transporter
VSLEIGTDEEPQHFHDELGDHVGTRLNWLRAAVLGANDGIVSTAGVVMGVAGATDDSGTIVLAGIAALTAGALSMGAGEYADIEFGIDPDNLTNPWHAAWASMLAFTVGALLPLLIVAFVPPGTRILVTVLSVVVALALTGFVSARIGLSPRLPAVLRNVSGGLLAMGVTYLIGMYAGVHL